MKARQQITGIAKHAGKTLVSEPLEVLKTAGEQVGVRSVKMPTEEKEQHKIHPSLEEQRRPQRLRALEAEIQDIREGKEQEARLGSQMEEEVKVQQEVVQKKQEKESFFQKFIKKLQRRVEGPKLPQAT